MPSSAGLPIEDRCVGPSCSSVRTQTHGQPGGQAIGWLLALALCPATAANVAGEPTLPAAPPGAQAATRVASRSNTGATAVARAEIAREVPAVSSESRSPVVDTTLADTVLAAKRAIAACQARYAAVDDYTCTFVKRERLDGTLSPPHVMHMKARTRPASIYFKFQKPNKGREAIYVAGRHKDHVLAHDVGLAKVIAGTMLLDPKGEMAMDGCRHPITEAGIGSLVDTVALRWQRELTHEESQVTVNPDMTIGPRPCTLIESVHPQRQPGFLFHKVKLYIDHELGLPVRFEAYDWPTTPGAPGVLVEEYAYIDLKLNVGLTDHDFDPNNHSYSFGRF